jgi:hypothetical protein
MRPEIALRRYFEVDRLGAARHVSRYFRSQLLRNAAMGHAASAE